MDVFAAARNKFTKETFFGMPKAQRHSVKRILKKRAKIIKECAPGTSGYYVGVIRGMEFALGEFDVEIKEWEIK